MATPIRIHLAALAASTALSACYVPQPASHARLDVSSSGAFVLNGQALAANQLEGALQARQAQAPSLVVEIKISPESPMTAVRFAVTAVRSAHARVAFAKEAEAS
jgi:biopolymer transport protein ExbD